MPQKMSRVGGAENQANVQLCLCLVECQFLRVCALGFSNPEITPVSYKPWTDCSPRDMLPHQLLAGSWQLNEVLVRGHLLL